MRPRTKSEIAFLALGETAEAFLRSAAAGMTPAARTPGRHRRTRAVARTRQTHRRAEPALEFRRFTADDDRAILAAVPGAPQPTAAGQKLAAVLPLVPTRSLDAYRADALRQVA